MQLPYGLWNGKIDPDLVANRGRVGTLKWNGNESGLTFTAKSTLYRKTSGQPLEAADLDRLRGIRRDRRRPSRDAHRVG